MALKLFKQPTENNNYTIDLTYILADSVITSIDSYYVTELGLSISNMQINSSILNETIQPGKAIQMDISNGQNGFEYTIVVKFTTSSGTTKETSVVLCVLNQIPLRLDYYGSVYLADTYFNNQLYSDIWVGQDNPTKRKSLISASMYLDRLNFDGSKTDENQILQFPRNGLHEVPLDIEYATFELSKVFLSGRTPQDIAASNPVKRDRFANVETEYDPRYTPEFLLNSFPSLQAWVYIKPYLRNTQTIEFVRT